MFQIANACEKTVMIGVNKTWPPYVMFENKNITGLDIETINIVFAKIGYCPKYRHFASSKRALIELKKGNIQMLKAASYTEERAQIATFTQPYRHENLVLFYNKESFQKEATLSQLFAPNHSFALSRGAYYGKAFSVLADKYPEQVKLVSTASQRFGLVDKNRVSYTIEDELTGHYFLREKGFENVFISQLIIHSNPVHFMFHRTFLSSEELMKFNEAIFHSKNEIDALIADYLLPFSIN